MRVPMPSPKTVSGSRVSRPRRSAPSEAAFCSTHGLYACRLEKDRDKRRLASPHQIAFRFTMRIDGAPCGRRRLRHTTDQAPVRLSSRSPHAKKSTPISQSGWTYAKLDNAPTTAAAIFGIGVSSCRGLVKSSNSISA